MVTIDLGYGFSDYTEKQGFTIAQHGEVFDKLMQKLGYERYVVQGGDWGSTIARGMARLFPERVKAVHLNMVGSPFHSMRLERCAERVFLRM